MRVRYRQVIVVLALSLMAAGCARVAAPPVPRAPTSTPGGQVIAGVARVDEIEVLILESFPVQVHVVARGNLPDGCTTTDQVKRERQGETFVVTITTVRPADQACTEALVPFEEVVPLDVVGLEAGTYAVEVNGVRGTFELAVDNKLSDS